MNKIKIIFFIVIPLFLVSCQSIKDGLSGKKSENSDEFLVQKKNPLVLPPDYMKLPKPQDEIEDEDEMSKIKEETDIQKILQVKDLKEKSSSGNYGNAEEFVLENIK
jgi:hypothetical protein|tara:strand:- start:107 stop:427 length:321 start_codon:yes stop_codon:yes gene_type:complete